MSKTPDKKMKARSDVNPCGNGIQIEEPGIVYDGNCPFCSWYVDHLADSCDLRKIDARTRSDVVELLDSVDIDIDRDMVLFEQGQVHQGAEALYRLARRSSNSLDRHNRHDRGFNCLQSTVFRWRPLAMVLYPVLRLTRMVYLRLSGRGRIHSSVKN